MYIIGNDILLFADHMVGLWIFRFSITATSDVSTQVSCNCCLGYLKRTVHLYGSHAKSRYFTGSEILMNWGFAWFLWGLCKMGG